MSWRKPGDKPQEKWELNYKLLSLKEFKWELLRYIEWSNSLKERFAHFYAEENFKSQAKVIALELMRDYDKEFCDKIIYNILFWDLGIDLDESFKNSLLVQAVQIGNFEVFQMLVKKWIQIKDDIINSFFVFPRNLLFPEIFFASKRKIFDYLLSRIKIDNEDILIAALKFWDIEILKKVLEIKSLKKFSENPDYLIRIVADNKDEISTWVLIHMIEVISSLRIHNVLSWWV